MQVNTIPHSKLFIAHLQKFVRQEGVESHQVPEKSTTKLRTTRQLELPQNNQQLQNSRPKYLASKDVWLQGIITPHKENLSKLDDGTGSVLIDPGEGNFAGHSAATHVQVLGRIEIQNDMALIRASHVTPMEDANSETLWIAEVVDLHTKIYSKGSEQENKISTVVQNF